MNFLLKCKERTLIGDQKTFPHLNVILDPLVGLHLPPITAVCGGQELVHLSPRLLLALTEFIQPRSEF